MLREIIVGREILGYNHHYILEAKLGDLKITKVILINGCLWKGSRLFQLFDKHEKCSGSKMKCFIGLSPIEQLISLLLPNVTHFQISSFKILFDSQAGKKAHSLDSDTKNLILKGTAQEETRQHLLVALARFLCNLNKNSFVPMAMF